MRKQELEKAFLSVASQSVLTAATLNVMLRYQARILAHLEKIDFEQMQNELNFELDVEIQELTKLASS